MAYMSYPRKRKTQIYLVAALLLISCLILVACNNDGSYDAGGELSEPTHFMAKFMLILNDGIGNFGWTVVVFTVILRLILSPLDIWQKLIARKNSKAMERMKPQLESLQEKYKNDKERYQQEQMALYKKEKYSMLGSCLPTIVTLVVFFVVFAGFRQMVGYQFALDYKNSYDVYTSAFTAELENTHGVTDLNGDGAIDKKDLPLMENGAAIYNEANDKAQSAVYDSYYAKEQTDMRSWLWIKNIFVPDTWKDSVPEFLTVTGQSGFATSKLTGITIDEYDLVMAKVLGTGGWGKNGSWNGWLLLPALSIALSFLSTKLLSNSQGTPPAMPTGDGEKKGDKMQANMKMMQYMMPVMMGVFALMYSGAFALYMFTSSLSSIMFQLSFNLIAKLVDKSRANKAGVPISNNRRKNG
jgi:YidC/Oxa1 family membrane protein insertase